MPQKLNTQLSSSNYGDFIDYGIDISSEDEAHINGWKIFYADNQGTYIIAADYIPYSNNCLKSSMSSENANMDNYSRYEGTGVYKYSAYWPTATYLTHTTTGISSGDAVIDFNAKSVFKYGFTRSFGNNNIKAIAGLLDTNSWSTFLTDGATYAIGSPTIELFRASWNEKKYSDGVHTKIQLSPNGTIGYNIGTSNDDRFVPTTTNVTVSSDKGYNDTLYYPHKYNFNNCNGYWIASPSGRSVNDIIYVHYNGDVVRASYDYGFIGVRPVVFLPYTVRATWNKERYIWEIDRE